MSVETAMAQIDVLTTELNSLRNEIVQAKANHAQLHQASVDANAQYIARIGTVEKKIAELQVRIGYLPRKAS